MGNDKKWDGLEDGRSARRRYDALERELPRAAETERRPVLRCLIGWPPGSFYDLPNRLA